MYEYKYAKVSQESTIADIEAEIKRLTKIQNDFGNEEQAIKIFINSIYGACASPYFVAYNPQLAEAITLQGQNIIKFSSKVLNLYFHKYWKSDKALHDHLGITVIPTVVQDVAIYGDTDSVYCSFQEAVNGSDYQGDPVEMIIKMYKFRIKDYLGKAFDQYATKWGTKNIQDFELETISASAILLAKKKYVLDLVWQDGISFEAQAKIKAKGVEIVQSSTPPFARTKLKEMLKYFFKEKKQLNLKAFVNELKSLKTQFQNEDVSNIAFGSSIGDYEKGIANDTSKFEILPHCPIHVRGAGYHNYLINQNPKYKKKYSLIKSGDKVKFYYAKDDSGKDIVFAYLPGNLPYEIAPSVDYELQFAKTIIDPLNRFISALGFPELSSNLVTSKQLF
ncbi:MAG: DNA polymerase domain-containing protein [Candidatus Pacearchaeota archaeon]|jgi:hypothetical protein|nr:hypothetical protein [Clostridia bacterium]